MRPTPTAVVLSVSAAAFVLAGCSGDADGASVDRAAPVAAESPTSTPTPTPTVIASGGRSEGSRAFEVASVADLVKHSDVAVQGTLTDDVVVESVTDDAGVHLFHAQTTSFEVSTWITGSGPETIPVWELVLDDGITGSGYEQAELRAGEEYVLFLMRETVDGAEAYGLTGGIGAYQVTDVGHLRRTDDAVGSLPWSFASYGDLLRAIDDV